LGNKRKLNQKGIGSQHALDQDKEKKKKPQEHKPMRAA